MRIMFFHQLIENVNMQTIILHLAYNLNVKYIFHSMEGSVSVKPRYYNV